MRVGGGVVCRRRVRKGLESFWGVMFLLLFRFEVFVRGLGSV